MNRQQIIRRPAPDILKRDRPAGIGLEPHIRAAINEPGVGQDAALNPAQAYATPINIQALDGGRAVATGDFSITADKVAPVLAALTANGIAGTALHSHLVGEEPKVYYLHFWADAPLGEVLRGLRAALDASR
ncbi:MAG TPA: DUF1259 domain-containing protein [Nitrospira sp.]|nr:DUF1259 domain-containing protein [Nitrospira sp.]